MDNSDSSKITPDENSNDPISFDDSDMSDTKVSHSLLNLGGGDVTETTKARAPGPQAATKPAVSTERKPVETITPSERITVLKTFFTKLHAGAIEFLDGQITNWLKNNPNVVIKRTNTIMGEIQGKKTEPNIIITVWY